MAKGLPKSYIKKYGISKKAWRIYRASKKGSSKKNRKRSNSKGNSARRNANGGGLFGFNRIPIPLVIGAAVGSVVRPYDNWISPVEGVVDFIKTKDANALTRGMSSGVLNETGWRTDTHTFDFMAAKGIQAELVGFAVHEFGKKLGVNRYLARYGIPYIGV